MLNPAFNINHMRDMAPIFYEVAHRVRADTLLRASLLISRVYCQLRQALKIQIGERPGEIDLSQWMGRTAIELIGQAGLGHSFDPLVEERSDTLGEALKSFVYGPQYSTCSRAG